MTPQAFGLRPGSGRGSVVTPAGSALIEFPPYRLDPRSGRLWHWDRLVELRPKAWTLLCYLIGRPGALVTKEELHAAVWGDVAVSDDTLTQTLGELRRALQDDPKAPRVIETVHHRGVRFIARVRGVPAGDTGASALVPEPIAGPGPPAALVGRNSEFATLWASFHKAAAGERQVVFVAGEPGIGKTSLVEAFLDALKASSTDLLIGHGQCVEQRGDREPYMPVLEALERMGHGPARDRLLPVLRVGASWLLATRDRPACLRSESLAGEWEGSLTAAGAGRSRGTHGEHPASGTTESMQDNGG